MSLLPITPTFFPRNLFDMDLWSRPSVLGAGPSTLDLFDPFDELDRMMGKNMLWLSHPEMVTDMIPMAPKVPTKYRITINCGEYDENSIKTNVEGDRLTVYFTKNGEKVFESTYDLPAYVDTAKLASFVTNGMMVIEFPIKEEEQTERRSLFPKIVEKEGARNVEFELTIPETVDPAKLHVVCKDRDVIVRADYKIQKPEGTSTIHWLKRSTFPENTDFDALKCSVENHEVKISAPLAPLPLKHKKHIPVEYKKC